MHTRIPEFVCGGQRTVCTSQLSHTALEIELELLGLVAKTFTHTEPSSLALAVISKNATQCGTQQALGINL